MAAFEDAVLTHGAELRTVRDEVGTRTIYEVVRYYGHWKKYGAIFSLSLFYLTLKHQNSKRLKEENRRRRLLGTKIPPPSAYAAPSADDSDSEGSIVRMPSKAHASCGACRTRDTKQWWKAPKGLATPVLCEACGISWRKYADLNHLRPIREEAAAAKQGKAEKREGTPLAGSNSKRVKVSALSSTGTRMVGLSMEDWRRRPTDRFRPHHRQQRVMEPLSIAVSHVTSTVLARSSNAKSAKRASILVSSSI